jgi:hypothetical protein
MAIKSPGMNELMSILIEATKKQGLSMLLSLGFAFLFFQQVNEVRKEQRDCMSQYLQYVRQDHEMMIKVIENNTRVMESFQLNNNKRN